MRDTHRTFTALYHPAVQDVPIPKHEPKSLQRGKLQFDALPAKCAAKAMLVSGSVVGIFLLNSSQPETRVTDA
jgi:hypothetical protein